MRFAKMQGVGNDFVVLAESDVSEVELPALALRLCNRHFSIGADGLLVVGAPAHSAAFTFRMFNPDGSEDMCGNGLRCAALWAARHHDLPIGEFNVATRDGLKACRLISFDESSAIVTVNMGEPKLAAPDLPMVGNAETFIAQPVDVLDRTFISTSINTGSTHTIVFLEKPLTDREFFLYSPQFENSPLFPDRTSVLWTQQINGNELFTRIWERGAGETLGCGTGACAVAAAAALNNMADRSKPIVVSSKGGVLTIRWTDTIWMTGPAKLVYEGRMDP